MSHKDPIEDIFNKRLKDEEIEISDRVWNNIQKTLPPESKSSSRISPFVWGLGSVILGITGILLLVNINNKQPFDTKSKSSDITRNTQVDKEKAADTKSNGNPKENLSTDGSPKSYYSEKQSNNNKDPHSEKADKTQPYLSEINDNLPDKENSNTGTSGDSFYKQGVDSKSGNLNLSAVKNEIKVEKNGNLILGNKIGDADAKMTKNGSLNIRGGKTPNGISQKDNNVSKELDNIDQAVKKKADKESFSFSTSQSMNENSIIEDQNGAMTTSTSNSEIINNHLNRSIEEEDNVVALNNLSVNKDSTSSDSLKQKDKNPEKKEEFKNRKVKKDSKPIDIKISTDWYLAPMGSYSSVSSTDNYRKPYVNDEKVKFSLGGGARINFDLSDHLQVGVGVNYASLGERIKIKDESYQHKVQYQGYWRQDTTGAFSFFITDTVGFQSKKAASYNNNYYRYLGIPLSVTYKLNAGNWSVGLMTGVSANFLIEANAIRFYNSGTYMAKEVSNNADSPYRSFTWSTFVNCPITYDLNDKWKLLLSPGFSYFINSIYKNEYPISRRPYAFDMKAGLRFILK